MYNLVIYIFICATTLAYGQEQKQNIVQKGAVTGKAQTEADTLQNQTPPEKRQTNATADDNPKQGQQSRTEEDPIRNIIKGLNGKTIRLEPLSKSSKIKFYDSAYLLLPTAKKKGKLPAAIKVRVIDVDSAYSTFNDYRLVIDSGNYAVVTPDIIKDTSNYFEANLLAGTEDVVLEFHQPVNKTIGTSQNITSNTKPVRQPTSEKADTNNTLLQYVVFPILIVAGLFLLLWAVSRFLIFSVVIKPHEPEITGSNRTKDISHSEPSVIKSELVADKINLKQQEDGQPITALELSAEENQVEKVNNPVLIHPELGINTNRYFFSEILVTAGPRKKYMTEPDADKDLGEDVCGFLTDKNQVLLWVLDGTSDQYCLKNPDNNREYFSSRLLAQSIAYKMRLAFSLKQTNLYELIDQIIYQVKTDWLQVITELSAEEKSVLKANIRKKNIPECATTLLVGHLSVEGNLKAYRSGDSKMILYNNLLNGETKYLETTLARKNDESNDRLFFRLGLNEEGEIDILLNKPKFEIVQQDNVQTLIAFSDGIGIETERLLKQPNNKMDEIRNMIIHQFQGTADDKSICFVEIREGNQKV